MLNNELGLGGVGSNRKATVVRDGFQYYLGRYPDAEATRREDLAREEFSRTGNITAVSRRRVRGGRRDTGETRLWYWSHFEAGRERELEFREQVMVAIVRDAVIDQLTSRYQRDRIEARAWVLRNDRQHPFSFATICDYFGIDVEAAREKLLRR